MFSLLQLVVILFVLFVLFLYRRLNYWPRIGIAQIQPAFPFGNFTRIFTQTTAFCDHLKWLYHRTAPHAPFVGLYAGLRPILFVRDPVLAQHIMVRDFHHFQDRGVYVDAANDPLTANLVALGGEAWKCARGQLTPAFGVTKMRGMFEGVLRAGDSLTDRVREAGMAEDVVEVHELCAQYTTNVIARVVFGLDVDCIRDAEHPFRVMGRKVFEPSLKNGIRDAAAFLFPALQRWLPFKSIDQDVEDFVMSMVAKNMAVRKAGAQFERSDFFQHLVQMSRNGTTDIQCAAHAYIFWVAGFETASTTMAFLLYELARNQALQRRVQQEIRRVLRAGDGAISYEAVQGMTYMDSCIAETLRKYPPLPFISRQCTRDWTIPGTDLRLPKGTSVMIPVHALQTDETYYAQPQRFDPDRFSDAASAKANFCGRPYFPFGAGPRNCIGARLGVLQTKVGLALMLRDNSVELTDKRIRSGELGMCPQNVLMCAKGGISLRLRSSSGLGE